MNDLLLSETLLTLKQAAREVPGCPVNPSTVYRWASRGHLLRGGQRVKLEAIRVAGRTFTSRQAITRFIEAQNAPTASDHIRSPASRQQAADKTEEELRKFGI